MTKKKALAIQFHTGEVAKVETLAIRSTIGDISQVDFVDQERLYDKSIDLNNYDHLIICTASKDFPEDLSKDLKQFIETPIRMSIPIFGIGFGSLILGDIYGYKIERKPRFVEINQIVRINVRNNQSDLTPFIANNISENEPSEFYAFTNHTDTITDGNKSRIIFSSEKCPYAGIEFDKNVYGTQFYPFLNFSNYKKWMNTYPDFWLNITGFHTSSIIQKSKLLRNTLFRYKYMYETDEYTIQKEQEIDKKLSESWNDLTKSSTILRNFINKSKK